MYRGEHQSDCYTEYVMPIFCQWTYVHTLPRGVESDYLPCQHDAGWLVQSDDIVSIFDSLYFPGYW